VSAGRTLEQQPSSSIRFTIRLVRRLSLPVITILAEYGMHVPFVESWIGNGAGRRTGVQIPGRKSYRFAISVLGQ